MHAQSLTEWTNAPNAGADVSYTYHSFLPNDTHAILNAWESMRDFGEVILAHGSLFDGERAVVRR